MLGGKGQGPLTLHQVRQAAGRLGDVVGPQSAAVRQVQLPARARTHTRRGQAAEGTTAPPGSAAQCAGELAALA